MEIETGGSVSKTANFRPSQFACRRRLRSGKVLLPLEGDQTGKERVLSSPLNHLLDTLDGYADRIAMRDLVPLLQRSEFDFEWLSPFLRFHPERYQRNLLRAGSAYHALLLCWRPGQRSPIHDHRGSHCAFRVLQGTATESVFDRTSHGLVFPTESRTLPVGTVCGSVDADIHQISNLDPFEDLVTLHVYSPPLLVMGQYSLTAAAVADFVDPVFEFSLGSGI